MQFHGIFQAVSIYNKYNEKHLTSSIITALHAKPRNNKTINKLIKNSFSLSEEAQVKLFAVIFHQLNELQKMQVLVHCHKEFKPHYLTVLIIAIFNKTNDMIKDALIELIAEMPDIEKSKIISRIMSLCENTSQKSDLCDQILTLQNDQIFLSTTAKTFEYMNIKQQHYFIKQTFYCQNLKEKFTTLKIIYEKSSAEQKLYFIDTIFAKFEASRFMLEVYEIFDLNLNDIRRMSVNDIKNMLKEPIQAQIPEMTFGAYIADTPSFQQQTL